MAARYDRTIVLWKSVLKSVKTQYSFYVMESRVSSDYTRNIHRPSTPEKEVNQKENTVGKIAKRPQIATDSEIYVYSDIERGVFLFQNVIILRQRK